MTGELFLPQGFQYRDEAIAAEREHALVAQFEKLPLRPFEFHGYLGKRRVASFGYRYDYAGRQVRESLALPDFLVELRETAAAFAQVAPRGLDQALVTEYAPGAGIGWHRDKPMFGQVVAFSFLSACTLRFRRCNGTRWERRSHRLAPRSAYILDGEARWDWEHSIPQGDALRYSVTFRNLLAPAYSPSSGRVR
jgi:alkylated DNA repair dioxygenase AlkB